MDGINAKLDLLTTHIAIAKTRPPDLQKSGQSFSAPAIRKSRASCFNGPHCKYHKIGAFWFSHAESEVVIKFDPVNSPHALLSNLPANDPDPEIHQDPVHQLADLSAVDTAPLSSQPCAIPIIESPVRCDASSQTEEARSTGISVTSRNAVYTPRCVEDSEVQATVEYKNKACDAHRVRTSHQSTSTPTPSADHGQPDEFEDALLDYAMRSSGLQRQGQSSQMQPAHRMLTTFLLLFLCLTTCQPACPAPTPWYHQTLEDEAQDEGETTICRQLESQAVSIGPHSAETLADL